MRPETLVQRLPEPAMNKNDQPLGRPLGTEKVKTVSRPFAVADVERCAIAACQLIAIGLRGLHPGRRPAFAAGNVGAVGVGVVPVGNLTKEHAGSVPGWIPLSEAIYS